MSTYEKPILTAEEELEILESLSECPYCEPDGSVYPIGMICRHCKGKHYLIKKD